MQNLEYKIGEIEIESNYLEDLHLFVVSGSSNQVEIYVSRDYSHSGVANRYHLDHSRILGGGSVKLHESLLKIGGVSDQFGSIPKFAAERFGQLIANYLNSKGIQIENIEADPNEDKIGIPDYWTDKSFRKKFSTPTILRDIPQRDYSPFDDIE